MQRLLVLNHVLIALFGFASGAYKLAAGEADVQIFSAIGMNQMAVMIFGGVQLAAALATIPRTSRRMAALMLAACNLLATAGLFVAGQQPFAILSILFVLMALVVAKYSVPAAA